MMNGGGRHESAIIIDGIAYLMKVKDIFKDNREKFAKFLQVMKDFHDRRIDVATVVKKMEEILKGHMDLILGFNKFLPEGYEIPLPPEDEQSPHNKSNLTLEDALKLAKKVKTRFQSKDHIYCSFSKVLKKYTNGDVTVAELYKKVSALLEGHTDLILEFTKFLP